MRTKAGNLFLLLGLISVALAVTMIAQPATAQSKICYDKSGLPIPCPPPKQRPKKTATRVPPTITPTPTQTETSTSTSIPTNADLVMPATAVAPHVISIYATETITPTLRPATETPTVLAGTGPQNGSGLLQPPSGWLPAIQKGLVGFLLVVLLIGGGLGFRRFRGYTGKSGTPGDGSMPPGPPIMPSDQFLKFENPGDNSMPPGPPVMPSGQFLKFENPGNNSLPPGPPVMPSDQFLKFETPGKNSMPPGPPTDQFLKFENLGDSALPPGPPTDQFLKFENLGDNSLPPGPPIEPGPSSAP